MAKRNGKARTAKKVWSGIPSLRSSLVAVDSIVPDPQNDLKHTDEDVRYTANSLKRSGQQKAIVVTPDGKTTIAGAGALAAAISLGWTHIAANRTNLTDPEEQRVYAIADNQTGRNASWNPDHLGVHLDDVEQNLQIDPADEFGFDLQALEANLGDFTTSPPDGDGFSVIVPGSDYQQMTFTLHKDQVEIVKDAVKRALAHVDNGSENQNRNGNGLAVVCGAYRG